MIRSLAVAVLGGMLFACDARTPTPSADPLETATTTATDMASPEATLRSFEPLPSRCPEPPIDAGIDLALRYPVRAGSGYAGVSLTSVQDAEGSSPAIDFGPPVTGWDRGVIRGGDQVALTFEGTAPLRALSPSSIGASLRLSDGRVLPVSVTRPPLELGVPDVSGSGSLDVAFEWNDGCYVYKAGTSLDVAIVEARIVDACPTGDAFFALLREHYDDQVEIGGIPVAFEISGAGARYTGEGYDADGYWPFGFTDATPVLSASPSSKLDFDVLDPDLLLTEAKASFYRRDEILAGKLADVAPFWSRRTSTQGMSAVDLEVPGEPGRYALHAEFVWGLPCAIGGAGALIAVDVE